MSLCLFTSRGLVVMEVLRDFFTSNYWKYLWIGDIIGLTAGQGSNGKYFFNGVTQVQHLCVFGTVVEVKDAYQRGILYSIDDGTGVIVCKCNIKDLKYEEIINQAEVEYEKVRKMENSFFDVTKGTEDVINDTADDSVFNDRTVQGDEEELLSRNKVMALSELWDTILTTFHQASQPYSIGDVVYIQGRLYNYFGEKQIFINSIRPLSRYEEIILMKEKLGNIQTETEETLSNMTFDNVDPADMHVSHQSDTLALSFKTPKRPRLSTSIVSPHVDPLVTFDSFIHEPGGVVPESDSESE